MKKHIHEVVVVEGKTDTQTLKKLYDVDTIETSGSGINDKIMHFIIEAAKTRGIIVLTDPDYPGMQIRQKIMEKVPNAKHAFIDKKDAIGSKKLGVAEARKEAIIQALETCVEFKENKETLTYPEFVSFHIQGNSNLRNYLFNYFNIGYGNNKTLYKRLNMLQVNKEMLQEAINKYEAEE